MQKKRKGKKTGPKSHYKRIPSIVGKLEYAFSIGCNITEACAYADISREFYYAWMRDNSKLSDYFERLRYKQVLKARETLDKNLWDIKTATWFLTRKRRKEFSVQITPEDENIDKEPRALADMTPSELEFHEIEYRKALGRIGGFLKRKLSVRDGVPVTDSVRIEVVGDASESGVKTDPDVISPLSHEAAKEKEEASKRFREEWLAVGRRSKVSPYQLSSFEDRSAVLTQK